MSNIFLCKVSGLPVPYRGGQCIAHQPWKPEDWLRHDTPSCDVQTVPRDSVLAVIGTVRADYWQPF